MTVATLRKELAKLQARFGASARTNAATLEALREDPAQLMIRAGMEPDDWQREVLTADVDRTLLLASRQSGKSSVAAAMALGTALLKPRSPVSLLSPTLRQSGELFRKVLDLYNALGRPVGVAAESALRLELTNGSRVVSLPGTEGTVRGFSGVALLLIDEAARVSDPLYYAVRPMLAVSRGRLVALSTPFGKRGFFHDAWHSTETWNRVKVTAHQCPRISAEFLAEERKALGDRWYRQEYECSFESVTDAVFSYDDIQAALSWTCSRYSRWGGDLVDVDYFVGLDLGQTTDPTALAVVERSGLGKAAQYAVRHMQRYPLGTAYTAVVPAVARLTREAPLKGRCTLVVDQTGVGRPLVEMLRREPGVPRVVAVTITAGHAITKTDDGSWHVPKKELVTCLQLLLQGRRLKVADGLPDTDILVRELSTFQVRITAAANETFGPLQASGHDDLVTAVAFACWQAERQPRWGPDSITVGPCILDSLPKGVFA